MAAWSAVLPSLLWCPASAPACSSAVIPATLAWSSSPLRFRQLSTAATRSSVTCWLRRFDRPRAMSAGAETHRETTGGVGASREVAGGADPPRAGANAALLARVEALHEVPGLEEEEVAAAAAAAAAGAERAVVVAVAVAAEGAVKVVAGVFSAAEEEAVGVDAEHACIRSHLAASASASASALVLGSGAEVGAAGAEVAAIGSSSDDEISM